MDPQNNNFIVYLILPDGGKVKFRAQQYQSGSQYWYKYRVTAIIDPYGLTTTIDTAMTPNNARRRITKVTEPAGRYLQFTYATDNGPRISQVQEFINGAGKRAVNYYYIYCNSCRLDHVTYYGNPNGEAQAHYQYVNSNIGDPNNNPQLLWTCDDPMYPGPMKRIAYKYRVGNNADGSSPVYGQLYEERYWDGSQGHETSGALVSRLTVGESPNVTWKRTETRGDLATRTFVYTGGGYVTWASDFTGHQSAFGYDSYKYRNSYTDFNHNQTTYTNDPITGNVLQVQFPLTPEDTTGQGNTQPTINYTYTNNYYLHTIQGENGQTTTITRDSNNRVRQIDYPDSGWEFFNYDAAHFYQLSSHRMITGGWEYWTYDASHRKETYRNPDNPSGNPTARYQYDEYHRLSGITDVLGTSLGDANHTTSFSYNLRGQLTVTTLPNDNGSPHTITNYYNDDGTLRSRQNELYQSTQYTYDNYRRLKSVQTPVRGWNDNGTNTTYFYYGSNWWDDDYTFTDSNVTYLVLPSGKKIKTDYDNNRRKISVTVGYGSDPATTSYGYDNVGNVTSVINPLNRRNISTLYDARNRPYSITEGNQTTDIRYDTAGHQKSVTRPNGQVITNFSFDAMNRVTRRDVTQTPTGIARSNYRYFPGSGLLQDFQDPHIFASDNSGEHYSYLYDGMGRKTWVTYPRDPGGTARTERFTYDNAGRLDTFKNRSNNVQTFTYDALNRMTDFSWNDGLTPSAHFGYDAASRLTNINNANANITRGYYYDNLLRTETEQILLTGGRSKTTFYTYNPDGNRSGITSYGAYSYGYSYTGRNQLQAINGVASYVYDARGNVTRRTLTTNGRYTDYIYDSRDRVTWATHTLTGVTRGFTYGYYADTDNRKYAKRTWTGRGEVFTYDQADQVTAVQHNITNPESTVPGQNIYYDSNGNRTWYTPTGVNKQYDVNTTASNLNQYNNVTINGSSYNLSYSGNANLVQYGNNNSSYSYDAQNRLTSATVGGQTMYFDYDGLNRQISRRIGANGTRTFNVWDGWDLIEEYQAANNGAMTAFYLYGATGLIAGATNGQFHYYFQDGSGSTSHLTDSSGTVLEWYRYDVDGTPIVNDDPNNHASALGARHLFTGQQWYNEIGAYDLRNRFYSPDLGRFLQPDPIGFSGDATNLYRYVKNNPVKWRDRLGLGVFVWKIDLSGIYTPPGTATVERIVVEGGPTDPGGEQGGGPSFNGTRFGLSPFGFGEAGGGPGEPGGPNREAREKPLANGPEENKTPKDNTPQQNPQQPNANQSPNPTTPSPNSTPTNSEMQARAEQWMLIGGGVMMYGFATKNGYIAAGGFIVFGGSFLVFMDTLRHSDTSPTPAPGGN